jgi:UDP-N-acetylmuramoyl-L-alanyl-D-glutamate--2,6-diaminopimelate ligase
VATAADAACGGERRGAMTVGALLRAVMSVLGSAPQFAPPPDARALDVTCTGVSYNSRRVESGAVFVALRGLKVDGAAFAAQAIARGAVAVVAETAPTEPAAVPWIVVEDARLALALLAAEFSGHPSRRMQVVGTTGTNGKTTTSWLVAAIFEAAGTRCGLMGTVAYRMVDREIAATRTTPEAPDLQSLLGELDAAGCGACALEVSSHALALKRVDGVRFAAGIFTNLTRDHLDFHSTMDGYFSAKRRLFEMLPAGAPTLVNLDDLRGAVLVETASRPVTYGIDHKADVMAGPLASSLTGLQFDAETPWGTVHVRSRLMGRPNAYNILAAVGAAAALDVPLEAIERGIESLSSVPGRFQVVSGASDDVVVIVDYAHTDDALRNLLETARSLAPKHVITVFGAGGDRDRKKRPLMGMVAARLSDVVVLTSDNPRGEDPARILADVQSGVEVEARQGRVTVLTIVDRREAIHTAIASACGGDVVLLAGKGHEGFQEVGTERRPFDDVAEAREALGARRAASRTR